MKRSLLVVAFVVALAGAFVLGRAQAQDEKKKDPMQDMAAWMDLGKPGPEHAEMKMMVGKWDCEVKSWHEPGKDPTVEKGTSTFSLDLGGLLLKQDYKGSMMGAPFTGVGYTAFNKATGKWEATWMDSMSSGILFMNGTEKDDVITYTGHFFGPGGAKIQTRYTLSAVKDDKQLFTMWMDMGQGMNKSMEMTYTRAK
ncbi:MAG: DUF1579 family protein [Planctomycetota bacterium]|jgi:hypothetical protein